MLIVNLRYIQMLGKTQVITVLVSVIDDAVIIIGILKLGTSLHKIY